MPQIGVSFFSLITSRAVCYRMIDWKKDLELLNERALKSLECLGLVAQELEPWSKVGEHEVRWDTIC